MHRFISFLRKSLWASLLLALGSGIYLSSQILPDAPVEGFRVTMFNDLGYKVWFLTGDSALYGDRGQVEVKGLDLQVYSGEEQNQLDFRLVGDNATYLGHNKMLFGDKGVKVVSEAYTIEGGQWKYEQNNRRIQVSENVKVVLDYEIEPFFK